MILRNKDKTCSKCDQKLGLRQYNSEPHWGFDGKLCHDCKKNIENNVLTYDVKYSGYDTGIKGWLEGKISLQKFDKSIVLIPKKGEFLKIPADKIIEMKISETQKNTRWSVKTQEVIKLRFEVDKNTIGVVLIESKKLENICDDSMVLTSKVSKIKPNVHSSKSKAQTEVETFQKNYGSIIKETPAAQYYGGHKAYLAGGSFSDAQNGKLFLTDRYLIFIKNAMRESKKWKITIPLEKVIIEDWKVDEKIRRKSMVGGGAGFGLFGGGGVIHDTGKAHDIVIPYVDENGITQAPRFGIVSFSGNAIREWAKIIYDQLVMVNKEKQTQKNIPSGNTDEKPQEDPIRILKIRLAKGEITKEEFDDLKSALE